MLFGSVWFRLVEYCSDLWLSMVQTGKIGRVHVENGLRLFQTGRVIVQTIFNGKDKGQVRFSTVKYGSDWGRVMSSKSQTNSDWSSKNQYSRVQIQAISDFNGLQCNMPVYSRLRVDMF